MMNNLRGGQGDTIGSIIRNEWAEDGTTLLLEAALDNIREEIMEDWMAGKRRLFVELSTPPQKKGSKSRRGLGEMLGMIRPPKVFVQVPETQEEKWKRQQHELKALRRKNDEDLASYTLEV